jgi:transposase
MPFAGLDLHKKVVEAIILDDDGAVLHRDRFPATHQAILAFAKQHLSKSHQVAVEATTNTWPVAALLEPLVHSVTVSNPMATRAIASSRIKTDKVDALVLAQLLRAGYLPSVWTPDAKTRNLRALCTERANLSADRTAIKNRIHAVLHQRLIEAPLGDLFSNDNLHWLTSLPLDPIGRQTLDRQLFFLDMIGTEAALFDDQLATIAYHTPEMRLLMTIPGFDFPTAQSLLATLGDWRRFPSGDEAASYVGLVPSTYQSANNCHHGPITKQGKAHTRWMLVQAAQSLDTHGGPIGVFFRRMARKKNRNIAVVATARKLAVVAWHMLTNNEPYRYADPKTIEAKFSRLRIRATGKRRKGGNPKGQPRSASYGSGQPSKLIKALDTVYEQEAIPALHDLAPGESRMLREQGVTDYVTTIRSARRVPKTRKA